MFVSWLSLPDECCYINKYLIKIYFEGTVFEENTLNITSTNCVSSRLLNIDGPEIVQFTLSCPIFWVNHLAALSEKTLFSTNAKFQTVWLSNFLPSRFRNGTIVEINDSNTWHWIVDTVVKCNLCIMGPKFFILVLRFHEKFSFSLSQRVKASKVMIMLICNIQIRLHRGYVTINPKEFVNNSADICF